VTVDFPFSQSEMKRIKCLSLGEKFGTFTLSQFPNGIPTVSALSLPLVHTSLQLTSTMQFLLRNCLVSGVSGFRSLM
jgi:hypothetical protein